MATLDDPRNEHRKSLGRIGNRSSLFRKPTRGSNSGPGTGSGSTTNSRSSKKTHLK